jgi:hypothetical protein
MIKANAGCELAKVRDGISNGRSTSMIGKFEDAVAPEAAMLIPKKGCSLA